MTKVLAFDIGIKNLAWACLEKTGEIYKILGWDNCNLLTDSSNLDIEEKKTCTYCKAKPLYQASGISTCVRHCPPLYPPLADLSGNRLKKIPSVAICREILSSKATAGSIKKIPVKRDELTVELAKHFSMPIIIPKVSKAPDANLSQIHDAIRSLVTKQTNLWKDCTLICLENQPVLKNPTMKSVQILLYATLRDLLQPNPPRLALVHAGKKVQGAEKGDAGYKDRKAGSEARIDTFLKESKFEAASTEQWRTLWSGAKKKSDLADALCMCIDHA